MGMMDEVKTKKKLKAAQNWFTMAENAKSQEKQIEYYTKSLDANPYNAEAWFRRGRIMEQMGHFNDAQKSFDHAIEIDPDYQGLIGKRSDSFESPVSAEKIQESPEFTTDENAYQENETDEQWITESFETEDSGFNPPIGDESIFADLGSNQEEQEEEENIHDTFSFAGTTGNEEVFEDVAAKPEQEMTFAAVSGTEQEEVVFSTSDEKENIDTFTSPEPEIPPVSDMHAQGTQAGKEEKKFVAKPGSDRPIAESMPAFDTGTADGGKIVDIRIPLNETLRFWLVGIVAIVIAFKILEFI